MIKGFIAVKVIATDQERHTVGQLKFKKTNC